MRPMVNGEGVGVGNDLMGKAWLESSVQELWEAWGIHFLILLSFSLQVFLFLAAGMRRRSTSLVLSKLLWLAYVSADSVAIFVLGHLASHAGGPSHHLMFFWAPFVLVHLGGQDTITAFSKQDNELWKRHLLNLVYQAGVAGYVVAKAFWPDGRLRAAMVLMFLSGFFRYAERAWCLFNASSATRNSRSLRTLALIKEGWVYYGIDMGGHDDAVGIVEEIFAMLTGNTRSQQIILPIVRDRTTSIISVDAPFNEQWNILAKDHLPEMLSRYFSSEDRCNAYEYLLAPLAHCYQIFYTKTVLRNLFYHFFGSLVRGSSIPPSSMLVLLCAPFQYASTLIALVLFWAAEKEDHHSSRADITVSYILLLGALVLDVSSVTVFIVTRVGGCIGNYFQHACSTRQWSGVLAQYNIIRRYIVQDRPGMTSSIPQCIGKSLYALLGVDLYNVTQVPLTLCVKEFILDQLVICGSRGEWNIASSRGQLAVNKASLAALSGGAICRTTSSSVAFPTCVLIWHIATEVCYCLCKENASTGSSSDDETKKRKEMSRELSNYVMYLVYKCGVTLTVDAQLEHDRTRYQIEKKFGWGSPGTEEAIANLFSGDIDLEGYFPVLIVAGNVVKELMSISDGDRWLLVASVWSEMLYYAAPRCGGAFHYEHLATGGEFVTQVLLLMYLLGPFMPGSDA